MGKPHAGQFRSRRFRVVVCALVALVLVVLAPWQQAWSQPPAARSSAAVIPITAQPFYPELLNTQARWRDSRLGHVVGESPRETLLNFYAVMAEVQGKINKVTDGLDRDPGFFWSDQARQRIEIANRLFGMAVESLDASRFPKSVRRDMADEAAMQLKEVLDYVLTNSREPIHIPDSADLNQRSSGPVLSVEGWTIPDTAITMIREKGVADGRSGFVFAPDTVFNIRRMYDQLASKPRLDQPFATPGLYASYTSSPGYIVPPKWYLRLPDKLRKILEITLAEQTLLQILAALVVVVIYAAICMVLLQRLLHTYRYWQLDRQRRKSWEQDNIAWYRVLLVLPILPLTSSFDYIIDDAINFTGMPLVASRYFFFICYFLTGSIFAFFLFEALGRSLAEWLVKLRGGGSDLQLRRVTNFVMPVSRVLGAFVGVWLIYKLLVDLGLPSSTVLAFSAVPGLAIGLGASKLLGNLFAGLAIQTDRPLRVGEFCRIGNNLGFVTKIGLRSLELQTLESRVTIPNGVAEEETIVNYSRRSQDSSAPPMQALELRLEIEQRLSPEQVNDLITLARHSFRHVPELQEQTLSLEQTHSDALILIFMAMVALHDWGRYLELREQVLMRLQQLVEQVRLSTITLGVSYDTSEQQLRRLPAMIAETVNGVAGLSLQSCRLMHINAFSYDIVFRFHSSHASLGAFKDALHQLNINLLARLAAEGIEIPFPTQVEINTPADR
ncbi:MAG: mechanosensitive ion channel family protein [Synechococcaceae cyanobacterium]